MRPLNEKSGRPSLIFATVNSTAASLAPCGQAVDDGPPGIAEAQELRHLVEGLAGRVVAGAAEQAVDALGRAPRRGSCGPPRPRGRGRAAGSRRGPGTGPRCGRRCGARARAACPGRRRGPWRPAPPRAARPRGPGPGSPRPRRGPGSSTPRLREGLPDHGNDVLDVMARGQLGHHPAVGRVQGGLGGHDARQDRAGRPPPRRPRSRRTRSRWRAGAPPAAYHPLATTPGGPMTALLALVSRRVRPVRPGAPRSRARPPRSGLRRPGGRGGPPSRERRRVSLHARRALPHGQHLQGAPGGAAPLAGGPGRARPRPAGRAGRGRPASGQRPPERALRGSRA